MHIESEYTLDITILQWISLFESLVMQHSIIVVKPFSNVKTSFYFQK